jgi:plastocyanin
MTNFLGYTRSFLLAALGAAALSTAVPVAFAATAYGSHGAAVHALSSKARAASHVGATPAGNAHLQSTGLRRLQALEKAKTVNLIGRHVVHLSIHNLAFGPARIKVSLHTRIVWTNNDSFQHTVTSDTGVWTSATSIRVPITTELSIRRERLSTTARFIRSCWVPSRL